MILGPLPEFGLVRAAQAVRWQRSHEAGTAQGCVRVVWAVGDGEIRMGQGTDGQRDVLAARGGVPGATAAAPSVSPSLDTLDVDGDRSGAAVEGDVEEGTAGDE